MPRIALLAGSKIAIVNAGDDAVILAPPPPREPVADVAAAVRDSLRFPLGGEPLEALVSRGGRATLVIEPPAQPVPQTPVDPRPAAIAAALERARARRGPVRGHHDPRRRRARAPHRTA